MRRMLLFVLAVLATGLPANPAGDPGAHIAATCADFSNQAAAQRAHNTRDADGDGIYCESLPCPCLKPGQGGRTPRPKPKPRPKPQPAVTCGTERWDVKTLQDQRAGRI